MPSQDSALTGFVNRGDFVESLIVATRADFDALVSASGLDIGKVYRVGTPEVWYRATSAVTFVDTTVGASLEYHAHFYAPLAIDSDVKARDISGALSDGAFQANLSAATAWATAGFLTQPNPTVNGNLSLVAFPALSWNWAAGDSLFVFWVGRGTPEGSDTSWLGDTSGYASGNGVRLVCTSGGNVKVNCYQNSGSVSVFGATSSAAVIEASVTHSFAVCISPDGMCYWSDGARNAGHSSGFLMPSGGPCDTSNAVTLKLGGDGATVGGIQNGIALQTKALVILKGRRDDPPAVADLDVLVAALHRNPQALVSSSAW